MPGKEGQHRADLPRCTVIIPTRDRPADLDRCLGAVSVLDYPNFDVLVIENAPATDASRTVAQRWGARYLVEPVPGASRTRNLGARNSASDVLAFLDDDAVPERGWLTHLAKEFDDPNVACAAGRVLMLDSGTEAERLFLSRGGEDLGGTRRVIDRTTPSWFTLANFGGIGTAANMALRRSLFRDWPGFNERLGRGTPMNGCGDHYVFFSLLERGHHIVYTPHAVVHHPSPNDMERLRARHLQTLKISAAYATMLLVEHPTYYREILQYIAGWTCGKPRDWREQRSGRVAPIVPRWRAMLACLQGPWVYMRSRFSTPPNLAEPRP
jgi:cellulose synthase/poly-beta-1,6-N-acetylglucosamine synthase-like glycosyltransferase